MTPLNPENQTKPTTSIKPSRPSKPTLAQLFQTSLERYELERKGAFPYEEYKRVADLVAFKKPLKVLEAGAGYGVSSIAMAKAFSGVRIDSLDKNPDVIVVAKQNAQLFGVDKQINYVRTQFTEYLKTSSDQAYDMVFFDGFAPGYTVFLELERVLRSQGIFVCANLQLRGDRKKIVQRFNDKYYYLQATLYGDTCIGYKL